MSLVIDVPLDTDRFTDLEILAMTMTGESESLGERGLTGTALTIINRVKANLHWLGGNSVRGVCLQNDQYDVWWPQTNNSDRERVLDIAENHPAYGPYILSVRIAGDALAGRLVDFTNAAVSYYDSDSCGEPYWAEGKTPCLIDGKRFYYDLEAITTKLPAIK